MPASGGIRVMRAPQIGATCRLPRRRESAAESAAPAQSIGILDAAALVGVDQELAHVLHPRLGVAPDFGVVVEDALDEGGLEVAFGVCEAGIVVAFRDQRVAHLPHGL